MRDYKGFVVKQRAASDIEFIVLVAFAKDVVHWSHADDIKLDKGNVQRELLQSRWTQVKSYLKASPNNIIPTSVTIAFDNDITRVDSRDDLLEDQPAYYQSAPVDGVVEISFPDCVKERSFIIDGQHRLKGMSEYDENILLPICLFPKLAQLERAFQFVTINNKAHKVPTDNLKALITNFAAIEGELKKRLTGAAIAVPKYATQVDIANENADSPFYKMVDWVNNRFPDAVPVIQPTSIENSLKAITRAFDETKDDGADAILVLSAIWRAIFAEYGITLANVRQFPNLTKKAVVQTITEMVVQRLVHIMDPAFSTEPITHDSAAPAAKEAAQLVKQIPPEFWKESWALKSLDTSAGREIIATAIRQLKKVFQKPVVPGEEVDWRAGNPLFVNAVAGADEVSPEVEEGN